MCDFAVLMSEDCVGTNANGGAGADEECPPVIVSWDATADIQSGDILIVRIVDSLLVDNGGGAHPDTKNLTHDTNDSRIDADRCAIIIDNTCSLFTSPRLAALLLG